jgi:hypothetical protein
MHYSFFKGKKARVLEKHEGENYCSFDALAAHWVVQRSCESQGVGDQPEARTQHAGIGSAFERTNLPTLTKFKVETLQRTENRPEDSFGDWASRLARGIRDTESSRLQIV